MKLIKKITIGLLLLFIGMQFYRPEKNMNRGDHSKVFKTETNPTEQVSSILESACYDCHSNNTQYPWYNNIAPISYWMADHIKEGKGELNFSEWSNYSNKKKDHKLEEIIEVLDEEEMPLNEYTWTHKEAKLTQVQKNAVIEWVKKSRILYQLNQQPK